MERVQVKACFSGSGGKKIRAKVDHSGFDRLAIVDVERMRIWMISLHELGGGRNINMTMDESKCRKWNRFRVM